MTTLVLHNIDDDMVNALKLRAGKHGISVEAEHRKILEVALFAHKKKSFAEILTTIPEVGLDLDFERLEGSKTTHVFD